MTVSLRTPVSRNWSEFAGWQKIPDQAFVPTPFIHKPWTRFQIDQFDHLEILGRVHRPQVISYLDAQGKPLSKAARQEQLQEALHAVLAPLGGKCRHVCFMTTTAYKASP